MVEWCARAHVRAVSTRTVAHALTARPLRPAGAPARRPDLSTFCPGVAGWTVEWGLGGQTRRNKTLNIFSHFQRKIRVRARGLGLG